MICQGYNKHTTNQHLAGTKYQLYWNSGLVYEKIFKFSGQTSVQSETKTNTKQVRHNLIASSIGNNTHTYREKAIS